MVEVSWSLLSQTSCSVSRTTRGRRTAVKPTQRVWRRRYDPMRCRAPPGLIGRNIPRTTPPGAAWGQCLRAVDNRDIVLRSPSGLLHPLPVNWAAKGQEHGEAHVNDRTSQPGSRHEGPRDPFPSSPIPPCKSENKSNRRRRLPGGSVTGGDSLMTCSLKWAKVVAIVLAATVPALFAGGYAHHKCTETTQDCLDHMAAKMKTSGWVGIELEHNETDGTLTITKVVPGSPAEAAGLQPGDELYAL